jgi:Fic family protein
MGRLWQTLILANWNEIFAWIPMESVLFQNRSQYYDVIQAARKANDASPFIEFTLSALFGTLELQAEQSKDGIKDGIKDGLTDGKKDVLNAVQKKIITLISDNPNITIEGLSARLGINKRNTEKNIKTMKDLGKIGRVGARKNGHWEVK